MKRILIIHPSQAVRETVALLLAGDYEIVRRDAELEGQALSDAVAAADLVVSSARPAARPSELAQLAAAKKTAVLLLAESGAVANSVPGWEHVAVLIRPFSPYDLKTAVANLLGGAFWVGPGAARGAVQASLAAYLEFPFLGRAAARLAQRFAAVSLPVLICGELGCGQDRVARAMESKAGGPLLQLNGAELCADYLEEKQNALGGIQAPPTVLMEGLERLSPGGQSLLAEFLDRVERTYGRLRLLATANADLQERVYRGEFLERLYYRLATLALPLAPLRQRRSDIPVLARWFAGQYAPALGLEAVSFTAAAQATLCDYLWFGNVSELELVIARTLATHGRARVDAADLVFDAVVLREAAREDEPQKTSAAEKDTSPGAPPAASAAPVAPRNLSGSPELRLLVHELAHELKNPMVTIKTFAQLLADRYDDAGFRARFQDVVDGDIGRMDDLLEVMVEFAGFDQPRKSPIALKEHLRSTLNALHSHCVRRQVRVGWKGNGDDGTIQADSAQVQYALKNTLLTVLSQTKTGSEIELAVHPQGGLTISYLREGEKIKSLVHYFNQASPQEAEGILPLRILLAREIVERNGGRIGMDQSDGDREILTLEFPVG